MKNLFALPIIAIALLVMVVGLLAGSPSVYGMSFMALGAVGFLMKDALLKQTKALPTAAAGSTSTTGIDLGESTRGDFLADVEFLLSAPALTTTMLPDTKTATYIIEHDTDSAFGTAATLIDKAIVQTGAAGAGAAAATYRFRLPTTVKRYVRAKCTLGANTTDSSTLSMTLEALL